MKVLLLDSSDAGGGAAIAAKRLCDALNEQGIDAQLYVEKKKTASLNVEELPRKKCFYFHAIGRVIENRMIRRITYTTNKILHTVNNQTVCDVAWINESDYDLVHIHWVNGTISTKDIANIKKPIIWTLHDSWPCCGAEHHPNILENDMRWREGYTRENKPKTTKGIDICRFVWERKKTLLKGRQITFIAPSEWEGETLKTSALFGENQCFVIPNLLPYHVYYGREKRKERELRGIPQDKKVIGFGAINQMDDPKSMKGTYYLIEALKLLENKKDYFVLLFGPATEEFTKYIPVKFYSAGFVSDSDEMARLYSCCDCFVNSSLIESLSYTVYESIACQIPAVAFDVGGLSDLIQHQVNGYLAKPYESKDLADGIIYCVRNQEKLSENCLAIREKFNQKQIINAHINAYSFVIKNAKENE